MQICAQKTQQKKISIQQNVIILLKSGRGVVKWSFREERDTPNSAAGDPCAERESERDRVEIIWGPGGAEEITSTVKRALRGDNKTYCRPVTTPHTRA